MGNCLSPPPKLDLGASGSCMVSITLVQAKNLPIGDIDGKADPYCVFKYGDLMQRSKTVTDNLDPIFNERIDLVVPDTATDKILIQVKDWDRASSDDLLGTLTIDVKNKWDLKDNPYEWYNLESAKAKPDNVPQIQLQVVCQTRIDPVSSKYYSYTHMLAMKVIEATDLKKTDIIGMNEPFCRICFGSDVFTTGVSKTSKNPKWNETCYIWIDYARQSSYKLLVQIRDQDITQSDIVGAATIDINSLLKKLNEENDFWIDLNPITLKTDAELSALLSQNGEEQKQRDTCGKLHLQASIKTKNDIETSFFRELLRLFKIKKPAQNEEYFLTRVEATAMLQTVGVDMTPDEFDVWWNRIDANHDDHVDEEEFLKFLGSGQARKTANFGKIVSYLSNGKQAVDSAIMGGITHPLRDGKSIALKDYKTGLIVNEEIPVYISAALKSMYHSKLGRVMTERIGDMLVTMSVKQGEKYDDPDSASEIPGFVKLHTLNTEEIEKPLEEYSCLNEFFARKLKEGARIVDTPEDSSRLISPADCRMMVFKDVIEASRVWVKGDEFTIENLLGPVAQEHAAKFHGGSFVIARLAPQDYHRWHIPCSGRIGKNTLIPGTLFTVSPIAIREQFNVYTENQRLVVELWTEKFGLIILIAVGATMVGSIVVEKKEGDEVKKGDIHGYFKFGGSTVLLLFQPKKVEFARELLINSAEPIETLIKTGAYIGKLRENQEEEKKS